jgi:hypothetical protein
VHGWKKRFFTLRSDCLDYDTSEVGHQKGSLPIKGMVIKVRHCLC